MRLVALIALVGVLTGCRDEGICDPERLRQALASAAPGDTVQIGRCTVPGDFQVPAGVTLEGVGASRSAIEALPGNNVASRLETSAAVVTRLRALTVRGGVLAVGDGTIALEELEVRPVAGVAVDLGRASASLRDVLVSGPIDGTNADDARWVGASPGEVPWVGVDARGGHVDAERVNVSGFARFGWVQVGGRLDARELRVVDSLSYGALFDGVAVEAEDLAIERTYQGLRGEPALALASRGSTLRLMGASLRDNDRYGLVAAEGRAEIVGLLSERSGDAALWMSDLESLVLESSELRVAGFAGLLLNDCRRVEARDLTIRDVSMVRRNVGSGELFGDLEIGDGLHLMGDQPDVTFRDVLLQRAERAGVVLELGTNLPRFERVRVEAADGLGAVAGRATGDLTIDVTGDEDWDEGIERNDAASAADAAFRGPLDAARLAVPAPLPEP